MDRRRVQGAGLAGTFHVELAPCHLTFAEHRQAELLSIGRYHLFSFILHGSQVDDGARIGKRSIKREHGTIQVSAQLGDKRENGAGS